MAVGDGVGLGHTAEGHRVAAASEQLGPRRGRRGSARSSACARCRARPRSGRCRRPPTPPRAPGAGPTGRARASSSRRRSGDRARRHALGAPASARRRRGRPRRAGRRRRRRRRTTPMPPRVVHGRRRGRGRSVSRVATAPKKFSRTSLPPRPIVPALATTTSAAPIVGQRRPTLGGGEVGDDVAVEQVDDDHVVTACPERGDDGSADARGPAGDDRHAASHGYICIAVHFDPVGVAMAMSPSLVDDVKQRAAAERGRTAYPAGFPVLPPVPAARYGDAAFPELEHDFVFARSWLHGRPRRRAARAPATTAWSTSCPSRSSSSATTTGPVRAFFNTCKHRGAALFADGFGQHRAPPDLPVPLVGLRPRGRARRLPRRQHFPDLDRDCLALTPCGARRGGRSSS